MKSRFLFPMLALAAGLALPALGSAAQPTDADVGDAGSFDKRMAWIGLIQTGSVTLASTCPPPNPNAPDDRCVVLAPTGTPTSASFVDLGRITLPKDSSDTLICHWVTPFGSARLENTTAASVTASFRTSALFRFESKVLQDPSLINPGTGLPFNGGFDIGLQMHAESLTLAPGESQLVAPRSTRVCIAGLVTRRSLIADYGLSEAQATKFFKEPITIRAGVGVNAVHAVGGAVGFGTRFIGDRK